MTQAPLPLVSTQWLAEHRLDPDLVVLESSVFMERGTSGAPGSKFRSGLPEFQTEGRVPGALFADLFAQFSDPEASLPFTRPGRAQFSVAASALGIQPQTHVVIYDRLAGQWASRLWWVFRSFGHRNVSVLDGGFKKYLAGGYPVDKGEPPPHAVSDYWQDNIDNYVAFRNDIRDIVEGRRRGSLVCLLNPDDYSGAVSVRSRAGHIPGSVNLPFTQLLHGDNTLRNPSELRAAFSSQVALDGGLIVTYCGGGIASTLGALALAVIGYDNTLEYDGSLVDWINQPDAPLETG